MGLEQLNNDEDISLVTYRVHPGANIHNWKNKVQTSFDRRPILMIHQFKKEYLELDLNEFVLVFDDGLYNHYLWFKEIRKKFRDVKMIFAISTNIISLDYESQDDMDSHEAHKMYFKHNSKIGFMNMKQIMEISMTDNCFIAVHGHNHLNLRQTRQDSKSLNEFAQKVLDEYENMFRIALTWIYTGIMRAKLMFVLPYNQYDELAFALMKKVSSKYDPSFGLIVMGPGRIAVEELL